MNVVVRTDDGPVSFLVDDIGDVVDVEAATFERAPATLRGVPRDLIQGVYKLPDRLLLVLDADRAAARDALEATGDGSPLTASMPGTRPGAAHPGAGGRRHRRRPPAGHRGPDGRPGHRGRRHGGERAPRVGADPDPGPDVVTLDVEMPVMDGLATLAELRKRVAQAAGDHVQHVDRAGRGRDARRAGPRAPTTT